MRYNITPSRKRLLALCLVAVIILTSMGLYDLYLHNFAVVIPKQVYRSRELSKSQFTHLIKEYRLKSIINLRGAHPGLAWYDDEIAAVNQAHIKHYDIALKSKILPKPEAFKRLVQILKTAPRPTLIHCESGVDRTGLASVLTLILANKPMNEVEKQVSPRHFVLSHKSVGKQFLQRYQHWLQQHQLTTSAAHFQQWLEAYK